MLIYKYYAATDVHTGFIRAISVCSVSNEKYYPSIGLSAQEVCTGHGYGDFAANKSEL